MMEMRLRRSWSPISLESTPSTVTCPNGSTSLNRTEIREDLPAPVRPTIPIWQGQGGNENATITVLYRVKCLSDLLRGFDGEGEVLEDKRKVR